MVANSLADFTESMWRRNKMRIP